MALASSSTSCGAKPGAAGNHWIDVECERRAADAILDTVLHVHHAGNFLDGRGYFRGPRGERGWILAEELDIHRLGRAGQVADGVLEYLSKFDIGDGLGLARLGADVRDYLFHRSTAFFLKLHQDVAAIGFGHGGGTKLEACAPRCALDLGHLADDGLEMAHDAIGFIERRSGGRDVIENERAFVHLRKQIGAGMRIAKVGHGDQRDGEEREDEAVLEREAQRALVDADSAAGRSGMFSVAGAIGRAAALP